MNEAIPINTQMALRGADTSNTPREGLGVGKPGDPSFTLQAAHSHAVAFGGDIARTLQARHDSSPCADRGMDVVAVASAPTYGIPGNWIGRAPENGGNAVEPMLELQPCQTSADKHGVATAMQVRRLTPTECEFLQGFPRNYTNIPWRGKPESPDGPRYKALGNSMAVPVMHWIGKQIKEAIDARS
jgi:DNA (cytosine-5)-methyltransferase 1